MIISWNLLQNRPQRASHPSKAVRTLARGARTTTLASDSGNVVYTHSLSPLYLVTGMRFRASEFLVGMLGTSTGNLREERRGRTTKTLVPTFQLITYPTVCRHPSSSGSNSSHMISPASRFIPFGDAEGTQMVVSQGQPDLGCRGWFTR